MAPRNLTIGNGCCVLLRDFAPCCSGRRTPLLALLTSWRKRTLTVHTAAWSSPTARGVPVQFPALAERQALLLPTISPSINTIASSLLDRLAMTRTLLLAAWLQFGCRPALRPPARRAPSSFARQELGRRVPP